MDFNVSDYLILVFGLQMLDFSHGNMKYISKCCVYTNTSLMMTYTELKLTTSETRFLKGFLNNKTNTVPFSAFKHILFYSIVVTLV